MEGEPFSGFCVAGERADAFCWERGLRVFAKFGMSERGELFICEKFFEFEPGFGGVIRRGLVV